MCVGERRAWTLPETPSQRPGETDGDKPNRRGVFPLNDWMVPPSAKSRLTARAKCSIPPWQATPSFLFDLTYRPGVHRSCCRTSRQRSGELRHRRRPPLFSLPTQKVGSYVDPRIGVAARCSSRWCETVDALHIVDLQHVLQATVGQTRRPGAALQVDGLVAPRMALGLNGSRTSAMGGDGPSGGSSTYFSDKHWILRRSWDSLQDADSHNSQRSSIARDERAGRLDDPCSLVG